MIQYLVINNNKDKMRSYAERFQVFVDREAAVEHFISIGGEEDPMGMGMGLSNKPGVASVQLGGAKDVDVMFMPILVQ